MNKFNDHQLGQVTSLATDLMAMSSKHAKNGIFHAALRTYQILSEWGTDGMTVADLKTIAKVCGRIVNEMPNVDEPRFNMTDYADAIANANQPVDLDKLLSLDDDTFAAAMIWLATDKRETYYGEGHSQEPTEIDIFK